MDVDALKNELEHHLAKNPDEHAPHGFRDRFGILVEQYQAEADDAPKAAIEAELQQIRNEAEAAANCACDPDAGEHATAESADKPAEPTPPREGVAAKPAPAPEPIERPAAAPAESAEPGFMQRYGLALIIAVVVLAAAWYFFRR